MVTTRSKSKKDKNKKSKASKSSEVPKSEVRDVEKVLRMQSYTGPSRKINIGLIALALAALIGGIVGIVMIIRGASDDTKKDPTSAPGTQAPGTQAPGTQAPGGGGDTGTGGGGSTDTKDEKSWAQKYWWVILLIVLAVIAISAGGVYAAFFRGKGEATQIGTGEDLPPPESEESRISRIQGAATRKISQARSKIASGYSETKKFVSGVAPKRFQGGVAPSTKTRTSATSIDVDEEP